MSKKIIVTGGCGYIGSHTVVELIESGFEVAIFDDLSNSSEETIERVEKITGKNYNLSRVGLIGDTLHTDILGANAFGIKSILMTNHGLFRNQKIYKKRY